MHTSAVCSEIIEGLQVAYIGLLQLTQPHPRVNGMHIEMNIAYDLVTSLLDCLTHGQ